MVERHDPAAPENPAESKPIGPFERILGVAAEQFGRSPAKDGGPGRSN